jgi:hypothetical protein
MSPDSRFIVPAGPTQSRRASQGKIEPSVYGCLDVLRAGATLNAMTSKDQPVVCKRQLQTSNGSYEAARLANDIKGGDRSQHGAKLVTYRGASANLPAIRQSVRSRFMLRRYSEASSNLADACECSFWSQWLLGHLAKIRSGIA